MCVYAYKLFLSFGGILSRFFVLFFLLCLFVKLLGVLCIQAFLELWWSPFVNFQIFEVYVFFVYVYTLFLSFGGLLSRIFRFLTFMCFLGIQAFLELWWSPFVNFQVFDFYAFFYVYKLFLSFGGLLSRIFRFLTWLIPCLL